MSGYWSDAYPQDPERRLDGPPFALRWPREFPPGPARPASAQDIAKLGEKVAPSKCKCGHQQRAHGGDRKGRPMCHGSVVCGCVQFRPQGDQK